MKNKCILTDKINGDVIEFIAPIYTKLNGIYGYIIVSLFDVYFVWQNESSLSYDIMNDRFDVNYNISK